MVKKQSENVIVRMGNMPLILTAPHGGLKKPQNIPDRVGNGSSILGDLYTRDIAEGIEKAIHKHYGNVRPYIVLNQISRRKADMNRSLKEGTETELGEQLWIEYHGHIENCIQQVSKQFNYAILIDIHGNKYINTTNACFYLYFLGHTHVDNMIELGYLLRPEELELEEVNDIIREKSSIKSLVKRTFMEPQETIHLLGDLVMANSQFFVTPSSYIPVSHNPLYFSGGFTTQNYNNKVDVIQVEIPKTIRHDVNNRTHFINTFSSALIKLLDEHYLGMSSKL